MHTLKFQESPSIQKASIMLELKKGQNSEIFYEEIEYGYGRRLGLKIRQWHTSLF